MRETARLVMTGAIACAAAGIIGMGFGAGAQSGAARPTTPSREWPTYGHDPGGMRFSPLNQITPANVGQLEVAWVYHMKPPATPAPDGRAAGADPVTPDAGPRSWTRRLGLQLELGHAPRHQRDDVYRDAVLPGRGSRPEHRQGGVGVSAPVRQPVHARRRVLARRRADSAADRLRLERRQVVFAGREDREAQRGLRHQRRRRDRIPPRSCRGCLAPTG